MLVSMWTLRSFQSWNTRRTWDRRHKGLQGGPTSHHPGRTGLPEPADGKGAPQRKEGPPEPVSSSAAVPFTSGAPYASAVSFLNGLQHQQPVVVVGRLSPEQLQAAQKSAQKSALTKSASSAGTPSASTSKQGWSPTEPIETDAGQSTQTDTTVKKGESVKTNRRGGCSVYATQTKSDMTSDQQGKTTSTSWAQKPVGQGWHCSN